MWVIVLLLLMGGTIVCVRVFRNEALGELEPDEPAPAIPLNAPATVATKTSTAKPAPVARPKPAPSAEATPAAAVPEPSPTPEEPPAPPATWPGGPCPACGAQTVPAAKFCGECGHKLTANS
ncbi:MAG TPA: hypothetical protein VGR43_06080 [Dehalococcoidia bacterium]|nr:hypothetical protein [Dehalococcoidia bacterium]